MNSQVIRVISQEGNSGLWRVGFVGEVEHCCCTFYLYIGFISVQFPSLLAVV